MFEFVVTTDMVEMSMRGNGQQFMIAKRCNRVSKRHDTQTGIHQDIPVTTTHMPDIATQIRADMTFPNKTDLITVFACFVPVTCDFE